jgi:hypothetical protein
MENIKIKKILIATALLVITGFYLSRWFDCHLDSKFFFSNLDLKLRVIFDIRTDQNVSLIVARLFHNKLTQGSADIFNAYVHFWDMRFLLMLLSPFTLFCIFYRAYCAIKEKLKLSFFEKILLLLCLFMPILIIFGIIKNEILEIIVFSFPLIFMSFRGLFLFIEKNSHAWAYCIFLIIFSFWYTFILNTNLLEFCHQ